MDSKIFEIKTKLIAKFHAIVSSFELGSTKKIFAIFAVLMFFSASIHLNGQDLTIPQGFVWKQLPFINGVILKPKDWFFFHRRNAEERKYLFIVSRENFEAGETVKTVLNIFVIKDVSKRKNMKVSEYSDEMIKNIEKKTKILKKWKENRGIFVEQGFFREDRAADGAGMIKEYYSTFSNDQTGTLYVISFVCPLECWDIEWQIAEIMVKSITLDEKY